MDYYYLPGAVMMCPNVCLINTPNHILFILSDAERAAITVWLLALRALIKAPCLCLSVCLLSVSDVC